MNESSTPSIPSDATGTEFRVVWSLLSGLFQTNRGIADALGVSERLPAHWLKTRRIPGDRLRDIRTACRFQWTQRLEQLNKIIERERIE